MFVTCRALPACLIRCSRGCRIPPTRGDSMVALSASLTKSPCKNVGDDRCSQGSFGPRPDLETGLDINSIVVGEPSATALPRRFVSATPFANRRHLPFQTSEPFRRSQPTSRASPRHPASTLPRSRAPIPFLTTCRTPVTRTGGGMHTRHAITCQIPGNPGTASGGREPKEAREPRGRCRSQHILSRLSRPGGGRNCRFVSAGVKGGGKEP